MPNWCEGNIKIRGKKKDVIAFLENEILKMYMTNLFEEPKAENIKMEHDGFNYVYELECDKNYLYLKDSARCFVEQNIIEIYIYSDSNKAPTYLTLNIKQAWGIDEKLFEKLSKKYNLDFNIYASEKAWNLNSISLSLMAKLQETKQKNMTIFTLKQSIQS